jgi:hypothetical protein
MPKMPCSISDGPQEPEDVEGFREVDEDAEYERLRAREIDEARRIQDVGSARTYARAFDLSYAADREPTLHEKIGTYTRKQLYSYDQKYWWSSPETALRMFNKLKNEEGTNHD